jgi:4-amino-4-deoxy-L-arabinose transferase-like glycosyltransferase
VLLEWLAVRARWLVPGAIFLHVALWTILPALINSSLPLDVVEALLWGREWQMGYDKHPPLSAWAAEVAGIAGGGSDLSLYLLSQICVAVGAVAMWLLARTMLDAGRAAFATLALLAGVYYMNFTSPEFNVNVLQIPLWGMLFLFFWRGVRVAKPFEPVALLAWVGVGACFGLTMLTKYLAAFALPPLGLFVLLTPTGRRALRTPGPYLAAVVAAGIFLPHFRWMLDTDFVTLKYGMRRASDGDAAWIDHIRYPLKFISAQAMASAATLVVFFFSGAWLHRRDGGDRAKVESRDATIYVWLIALAPVLSVAAYSLVTGARLRSMWGTSMVIAVPLLLTMLARFDMKPSRVHGFLVAWSGLFVLALGAYFADNAVAPRFANDAKRTNYPGREFALRVESAWGERVSRRPLIAVIGDEFYGGLVSWYGNERALVYIDGSTERTFWVDDSDIEIFGAMVVWKIGMADRPGEVDRSFFEALRERFPAMIELEPITLTPGLRGPFGGPIEGAAEILGLGFIPPSGAPAQ